MSLEDRDGGSRGLVKFTYRIAGNPGIRLYRLTRTDTKNDNAGYQEKCGGEARFLHGGIQH
jgi:hypothetical protein